MPWAGDGMYLSRQSAFLYKPDVAARTCVPSTRKSKAGGSEVQVHPQLHSGFKVSLGYMILFLNLKKKS